MLPYGVAEWQHEAYAAVGRDVYPHGHWQKMTVLKQNGKVLGATLDKGFVPIHNNM
jgi:hypothetical protein